MKKIIILFALFASVCWLGISDAMANSVIWISDSSGNLGFVDADSGKASSIGKMNTTMTDIAFDSSGQLWGISFYGLYKIDSDTAAVTHVGSSWSDPLNSLVFSDNGTLYAGSSNSGSLYSINTDNGILNSLGDTGFKSSGDLAFNNGSLYMSAKTGGKDKLVKINLSNFSSSSSINNLGYSNVYGMVTGDDGILYGLAGKNIFTIDPGNGNVAYLSRYRGSSGLKKVWGAATESTVPVPGTVWLLGSGLICFTGLYRRRQQP